MNNFGRLFSKIIVIVQQEIARIESEVEYYKKQLVIQGTENVRDNEINERRKVLHKFYSFLNYLKKYGKGEKNGNFV